MKRLCFLFVMLVMFGSAWTIAVANEKEDDIGLNLAKIRLHLQNDDIFSAFDVMEELKERYSGNTDNTNILLAEADIFLAINQWHTALHLIEEAESRAPDDENIKEKKREVLLANSPYVMLDREIESRGQTSLQQITRLSGELFYTEWTHVGALLENNRLRARDIITPGDGVARSFKGNEQRAELFVTHDFQNSDSTKISLFLAEDTVGVGGEYRWFNKKGDTVLQAYLQRPDWDFIEGIIHEGTKDSLIITQSYKWRPRFNTSLGLGVHNYGIDDDSSVVQSFSVQLAIGYIVEPATALQLFGQNSTLSLNYVLDADYGFDEVDTRLDGTGAAFRSLSFVSTEIHSLTINIAKEFSKKTRAEGFAGLTFDRLGGEGPSIGGLIAHKFRDNLELQIRGARTISGQDSNDVLERIDGSIRWIF